MFKWKILGRIFNPADVQNKFWLHEYAQAPAVLLFDKFVRVYFSCRPPADQDGQYVSYSAFIDLNRYNLFEILNISAKPILELGDLGTFDEFGTYPVSIIRSGKEIFAYYGGWTRCESVPFNVAIGLGISSDDGITFKKCGNGPVLSYTPDEPFILSGPKIRRFNGLWQLWYIAGRKWIIADGKPEPVYKIRLAISRDGFRWEKVNRDLIAGKIEDEAQASPDVIFQNGRYHMFFCYRYSSHYRGKDRGYRIGYASSADMLNWIRDDSRAGIDVSEDGWDSEMVSYPHVFELDGHIYMLYLGNSVGRHGFGIAQLEGILS
ncbi:MAG: glycosylase [Deltaproteobacteria bacterium HGW-Deltaproteobacteria-12]|jgi:predicted GH43/DUF377 family glycosyl hydrolase|nr:MAG: glycosylase [Deltaproteobacteria bacterium HGW-Deltaproteobacteria-12]